MWFDLKGDSRLGRCTSEDCGGQPTFRLESGGVGSNYCSGCKASIDRLLQHLFTRKGVVPVQQESRDALKALSGTDLVATHGNFARITDEGAAALAR